jgi:dTDP-4-dehydrorhamnose reductase
VFDAAAYTAVDKAEGDDDAAAVLNGDSPGWMAAASRAAGARFVHISTDFVFDGTSGSPYRPEDPTNPQSVYGSSKLDGERSTAAAYPEALIVRTAWVYAPRGANFVRTMLRLMGERERLTVVSDQVGDPHVCAVTIRHLGRPWGARSTLAREPARLPRGNTPQWLICSSPAVPASSAPTLSIIG